MSRPNVIFITCHDLGDFLGCYGTPVETPNLNRLAGQGILLANHFATASICSPSRASILTGCYPHTHGLLGVTHRGWRMDLGTCATLPSTLRDAGYGTHLFGVQHEHRDAAALGYAHVHPVASKHADDVAPAVEGWLRAHAGKDGPFFASVGFAETHRTGLNPSRFAHSTYRRADPARVAVPAWLPDIPEVRGELADLYGAIRNADENVGRILSALDASDLSGNTLVIFTADHGIALMHAKGTLYDGGTKVACLARWPGGLSAGRRCQGLSSHLDWMPTILEFCGIPVPSSVQGASMSALLDGRSDRGRACVFAEENYTFGFNPRRMVRTHDRKYIRNALNICVYDYLIAEIELSAANFRRNRPMGSFYSRKRTREELYDLREDPAEMHNLAEDSSKAGEIASLRQVLDHHLCDTGDPFAQTHVPLQPPVDGW